MPSRLPPSDCPRAVEVYARLYSPSALATSIKLRWACPIPVSAADGRLRSCCHALPRSLSRPL